MQRTPQARTFFLTHNAHLHFLSVSSQYHLGLTHPLAPGPTFPDKMRKRIGGGGGGGGGGGVEGASLFLCLLPTSVALTASEGLTWCQSQQF